MMQSYATMKIARYWLKFITKCAEFSLQNAGIFTTKWDSYSWTHIIRILEGIQNLFELNEFSNYRSYIISAKLWKK